ncbi:hypothetical protein [Amycolatopsis sp. NPDC098790]|uniref:hypothetical protein n=1 Tax=Amycolatopsis sp. NPDC098790 TaxID=3363939 RepID=UPI003814FFD7
MIEERVEISVDLANVSAEQLASRWFPQGTDAELGRRLTKSLPCAATKAETEGGHREAQLITRCEE